MEILEEELLRKSVFKDVSKLSPDYVPKKLLYRDEEFRALARIFKPVIESKISQRALITGSVGVGKTVLAKKFGEEIVKVARKKKLELNYIHINCRKERTVYAVLMDLVHHYNPTWPIRGVGAETLLDMTVEWLSKHDCYWIVALDEIDYFTQLNGPDLLYSLSRVAEFGAPNRISLIAISRDKSFLYQLDPATQSTFMHNVLALGKYTAEQLEGILNQRAREAFKMGAVNPETISLIANIASRWGDARFALELLWRAGTIADGEDSDVVLPEHARKAKEEIHPEIKKEVLRELELHEKLLLLAIARRLKISKLAYASTGEVERSYCVVCEEYGERPLKHTQFLENLSRIQGLGLVDIIEPVKGRRGRTKGISIPDASVKALEEELEKLLEKRTRNNF
ncbi:MAG: hypothetical protein APU95_05990 [Hadesarchaea archaeon YNP_N21]|jgi:cell division control protein 6|nr:MAG: hypothetical protein APU95_05990 [Hadesarchaea archaeon YNP_N21]